MPLPKREFTVDEAQAQLPELVQRVEAGETLILTAHGEPIAAVRPLEATDRKRLRTLGGLRGTATYQDDLIAPLDEPWEAQ